MEVELSALLVSYDRPTEWPTNIIDRRTDRVKRKKYMHVYVYCSYVMYMKFMYICIWKKTSDTHTFTYAYNTLYFWFWETEFVCSVSYKYFVWLEVSTTGACAGVQFDGVVLHILSATPSSPNFRFLPKLNYLAPHHRLKIGVVQKKIAATFVLCTSLNNRRRNSNKEKLFTSSLMSQKVLLPLKSAATQL